MQKLEVPTLILQEVCDDNLQDMAEIVRMITAEQTNEAVLEILDKMQICYYDENDKLMVYSIEEVTEIANKIRKIILG